MAEDQHANPAHQSHLNKTGGNASILEQAQSIPQLGKHGGMVTGQCVQKHFISKSTELDTASSTATSNSEASETQKSLL